jgi:hypothetical protein
VKISTEQKTKAQRYVNQKLGTDRSYKIFDKMITELSLYMMPIELDRCQSFLFHCEQGNFDTNLTIGDMESQLKIILGSERYHMIKESWRENNQKILSVFGQKKFKHKKTGELYDGLDDGDNPQDYEKVYV